MPGRVGAQAAGMLVASSRWSHREARRGPVAARMPGSSHRPAGGEGPRWPARDSESRAPGQSGRAGQLERHARPAFSLLNARAPSPSPPAGWLRGLGRHWDSVPLATCQPECRRPVDWAPATGSHVPVQWPAPPQRWPGPSARTGPGPQPQPHWNSFKRDSSRDSNEHPVKAERSCRSTSTLPVQHRA